MDLLLPVVLLLQNVLIQFFYEVVLEVEYFPAQGLEALILLEEVGEFGEITSGHLVVALHE